MIIIGGEPPHIDNPKPTFGGLLSSLNNLRFKLEDYLNKNEDTNQDDFNYIADAVKTFEELCCVQVDAHVNQSDNAHGETSETIGKGLVDNFRTATIQDHLDFVDDAFCTPEGIKKTVEQSVNGFNLDNFQQNIRLPFAMLHHIDQFKRIAKDQWSIPWFKPGKATVIMNADRVIISSQYEDSYTGSYSNFYSDTIKSSLGMSLNEERMCADRYVGNGWNMKGAADSSGKIGIFRPLANKGIYDYETTLPVLGNCCVLLSTTFGNITHKGCLISAEYTGDSLLIAHYFFGVDDPENDATLRPIIDDTYLCIYNTVNMNNVTTSLQNTRSFSINDWFSLGAGVSITIDLDAGEYPTVSADWRYINTEFLLNYSVPIILKVGDQTFNKIFTFTEAIRPGKLIIVDTATCTLLKPFAKDVINTVDDIANSQWLVDNDPGNLVNLVSCPGVINENGLAINAYTTRNSLRVKLTQTDIQGVIPFLETPGMVVPIKDSVTKFFTPTRHFSFGELSERILPMSQDDNGYTFLSFCLAADKNQFKYKEIIWNNTTLLISDSNLKRYTVDQPNVISEREIITELPNSLMVLSTGNGGVSSSALALTDANGFTGYSTFNYAAGTITLGDKITLSSLSELQFNLRLAEFNKRSAAADGYNGESEQYNQELSKGLFTINSSKALCYWSDGIGYVEVCLVGYTITDNVMSLDLNANTVGYVVATPVNPSKGRRISSTGDDLYSPHSDLLVYKKTEDNYLFILNKPFGMLAGDVSFSTSNFRATDTSFDPIASTQAKMYENENLFDVAEEHEPALLIPKYGLFQNTGNETQPQYLSRIDLLDWYFDPYTPASSKFIIIPEGFRCVLNGIGVELDETQELSYTTGPIWFYIEENQGSVGIKSYTVQQRPENNAVLVGWDLDGTGIVYNQSCIVINKHMISSVRKGSTIPVVNNDGGFPGYTDYFREGDIIWNNQLVASVRMTANYSYGAQINFKTGDVKLNLSQSGSNAIPYFKDEITGSTWNTGVSYTGGSSEDENAAQNYYTRNMPGLKIGNIDDYSSATLRISVSSGRNPPHVSATPSKANGWVGRAEGTDDPDGSGTYIWSFYLTLIK